MPFDLDPNVVAQVKQPVMELDPDIVAQVSNDQNHFDQQTVQRLNDTSPIGLGVRSFFNPLANKQVEESDTAQALGIGANQGINELGNAISQQKRILLEGEGAGKAYYERKKREGTLEVPGYEQAKSVAPITTEVGKFGAQAVAASPLGVLGGASGAIAGGALLGGLQVDPEAKLSNTIENATVGGLTGGALYGAGKLATNIPNMYRGIKLLFKNSDDVINTSIENTLAKSGTNIADATPEAFMKKLQVQVNKVEAQKNALYEIRNNIATKEGAIVTPTNLGDWTQAIKADAGSGRTGRMVSRLTPTEESVLGVGQKIYADGSPMTYNRAQKLVDDWGKTAYNLSQQHDDVTAALYQQMRRSLQHDIDNGTGSAALKEAHQIANNYNAQVYAPLRNLDVKDAAANRFGTESFITSLIKSNKDNFNTNMVLSKLPQEDRNALIGAYGNILRESKMPDGSINLNSVAKGIRDLSQSPNLEMFGPIGDDIETLSQVLGAKQTANKANLTSHSMGQAGAMGTLGKGVAAIPYFAVQLPGLAKVGRLINNKAAQNLLNARRVGGSTMSPATREFIDSKIIKLWGNMGAVGGTSATAGAYTGALQNEQNGQQY